MVKVHLQRLSSCDTSRWGYTVLNLLSQVWPWFRLSRNVSNIMNIMRKSIEYKPHNLFSSRLFSNLLHTGKIWLNSKYQYNSFKNLKAMYNLISLCVIWLLPYQIMKINVPKQNFTPLSIFYLIKIYNLLCKFLSVSLVFG